jgi:hypothetical protein
MVGAPRVQCASPAPDYDDVFALLLLPFFLAFGDPRLVFVLGVVLLFQGWQAAGRFPVRSERHAYSTGS